MENFCDLWLPLGVEGSPFNQMLYCGNYHNNRCVAQALRYLPPELLCKYKDKLAFFSTAIYHAYRIARKLCQEREIILLSERIFPKEGAAEDKDEVRFFIFTVLHEVAHAIKEHRSPLFDKLTQKEKEAQEQEADNQALTWFNEHVKLFSSKKPYLKPITLGEIEKVRENNQNLIIKMYEGKAESK